MLTSDFECLIKLSEIKEIYAKHDNQTTRIDILKEKLKNAVKHDDWCTHTTLIEHDYCLPYMPDTLDCIIYCTTEFICNKFLQNNHCTVCRDAIINTEVPKENPRAALLTLKTNGDLVHPNERLYSLVYRIEILFQKHCESKFVYEEIINDTIDNNILTFPCEIRGAELLTEIIHFYIRMRIQKYISTYNQETTRNNMLLKKHSKFCKT